MTELNDTLEIELHAALFTGNPESGARFWLSWRLLATGRKTYNCGGGPPSMLALCLFFFPKSELSFLGSCQGCLN